MGRGRPGGNPEAMAKPLYGEPMANKSFCLKLPIELDQFLRSLPNKAEWVREAIAEKRQRELGYAPANACVDAPCSDD